jgi:hypothetical protein
MPMTYNEIKAWRDKEQERLQSISDEYEKEWCEKTVIILTAVLQDDVDEKE